MVLYEQILARSKMSTNSCLKNDTTNDKLSKGTIIESVDFARYFLCYLKQIK